jgi:cell division protein FtsL
MELIALAGLAGLSLLANGALYALYRRRLAAAQAALEAAKKRSLSIEAAELLQDLATAGAIVRIERIDPEHLFMWRPR